jgi:transcriptional regulator with XRE-family HTH domain
MPAASISKQLGQVIRARRLKLDLSQETLAEKAGVHPTYLGMVERGIRNPTLDVCVRLATALKITPAKLVDEAMRSSTRVPGIETRSRRAKT